MALHVSCNFLLLQPLSPCCHQLHWQDGWNGTKQSVMLSVRVRPTEIGIRATGCCFLTKFTIEGCVACTSNSKETALYSVLRFLELGDWQRNYRLKAAEIFTPPPVDNDLHAIITNMGAIFSDTGAVETFQNDKEALAAAESDVAVVEMSQFGRLWVTGEDRICFLHNQSTADFQKLKDGEGCDTVLVTSTGRTINLAKAWVIVHTSNSHLY